MKIKEKNKELIKDILFYLGFAIIAGGYVFSQNLRYLDEVWVYNFARGIANRTFTI